MKAISGSLAPGHATVQRFEARVADVAGLGMALGGWIGGVVYDLMGSYNVALMISIAASLGGMVNIFLLDSPRRLLIPDWEAPSTQDEDDALKKATEAPSSATAD